MVKLWSIFFYKDNLTLINENDQENDDVSGVMLVMVMVMVWCWWYHFTKDKWSSLGKPESHLSKIIRDDGDGDFGIDDGDDEFVMITLMMMMINITMAIAGISVSKRN